MVGGGDVEVTDEMLVLMDEPEQDELKLVLWYYSNIAEEDK